MANQSGIAISIKAFLPTGKTIDEQFAALTLVKDAHASGDYTELLKAATIDEVKAEQKTRRTEDKPGQPPAQGEMSGLGEVGEGEAPVEEKPAEGRSDADPDERVVPDFIKKGRKSA